VLGLALIPPAAARFWGELKRALLAGRSATRFAGSATPEMLYETACHFFIITRRPGGLDEKNNIYYSI